MDSFVRKFGPMFRLAILMGLCFTACSCALTQRTVPPTALEQQLAFEIEQYGQADKGSPPAPCQVLFVGSSSIAFWKTLAQDMAPLQVLNRGFGGSHIEYVNRWFSQIVAPYRPRAIVFYGGENDIDAGKSVHQVVADFDTFMRRKSRVLGAVPVYFISIKPSKRLFEQLERQTAVNWAVRARAGRRADLQYIDVATLMLEDGKPKEIFLADKQHMGPEGYAIWTQVVRAALLPNAKVEARSCRGSNST